MAFSAQEPRHSQSSSLLFFFLALRTGRSKHSGTSKVLPLSRCLRGIRFPVAKARTSQGLRERTSRKAWVLRARMSQDFARSILRPSLLLRSPSFLRCLQPFGLRYSSIFATLRSSVFAGTSQDFVGSTRDSPLFDLRYPSIFGLRRNFTGLRLLYTLLFDPSCSGPSTLRASLLFDLRSSQELHRASSVLCLSSHLRLRQCSSVYSSRRSRYTPKVSPSHPSACLPSLCPSSGPFCPSVPSRVVRPWSRRGVRRSSRPGWVGPVLSCLSVLVCPVSCPWPVGRSVRHIV